MLRGRYGSPCLVIIKFSDDKSHSALSSPFKTISKHRNLFVTELTSKLPLQGHKPPIVIPQE